MPPAPRTRPIPGRLGRSGVVVAAFGCIGSGSDVVDGQQALLDLPFDPCLNLDVRRDARGSNLGTQQLVELEEAGRVVEDDLDVDGNGLATLDDDALHGSGREGV